MEQVERRLSFTGLTINSDPSFRMQTRPSGTGIAPGAGKPREDFGSSGFKLSPRKSKLDKMRPTSTQSIAIPINFSEDDDDIDLIDLPPGTSQLRKAKVRTATASSSREVVEGSTGVTYKGQVHEYHPDFLPKPKLPSFKKNKSTNQIRDDGDDRTSSRADTPEQPQQSNPPPKDPPLIQRQMHQTVDKEIPPTPQPRSSQPGSSPPPNTRPKRPRPRPITKTSTRILRRVDSSDDSDNPVRDRAEEDELVQARAKERPKATKKQLAKRIQRKFPLLDDPAFKSDQPLRLVSNLSSPRSRRSSPDDLHIHSCETKGTSKAPVISDDDMEDRTGQAPLPFPLSTSFMGSTPKASKRHPEDETHSGGSERKKLKESLSE